MSTSQRAHRFTVPNADPTDPRICGHCGAGRDRVQMAGESGASVSCTGDGTPGISGGVSTLRTLLAELPDEGVLPIGWFRKRLEAEALREEERARDAYERHSPSTAANSLGSAPTMLSAEAYGAVRQPARTAEWVRDACRAGRIPGARKDGAAWSIPATSLGQEQGARSTQRPSSPDASATRAPTVLPTAARRTRKEVPTYPRWGTDG